MQYRSFCLRLLLHGVQRRSKQGKMGSAQVKWKVVRIALLHCYSLLLHCYSLLLHCYSLLYSKQMTRVGLNCKFTPNLTVYLVISLLKIPFIHRIYMVLDNPTNGWWWCSHQKVPLVIEVGTSTAELRAGFESIKRERHKHAW